jgi:outer membrane protein TolC
MKSMSIMKLCLIFIFVLLNFSYTQVHSNVLNERNIENRESITLIQFLENLEQSHPLFEREQINSQIAREEQKSLTGAENWIVSSGVILSHMSHSPVTAGLENANGAAFSTSVSRHFWSTGGNLSAGLTLGANTLNYSSDTIYSSIADANFDNNISLSYSQPLLKNLNGILSKLEYDLKTIKIDLTEMQTLENQEDFLASSAQSFLNWVFYAAEIQLVQERLQLSRESLHDTRQKRARNLVDEVDVIRAKNSVSLSEQNQVTVESNLAALSKQLSILMQDDDLIGKSPQFDLYQIHDIPNLQLVIDNFKQDSRVLSQLKNSMQQLELMRRANKESTKPDLNLTAQVATKKSDDNFSDALVMDKPEASLSLTYTFPLKNTKARTDLLVTDLQIVQLNKQIKELEITQISVLSNILVQLKQLEKILELNKQQIELAKQKTVAEISVYNHGRGDFTNVIQSQDEEERAKLTYAKNALIYQKLHIEYLSMTDQLLQN